MLNHRAIIFHHSECLRIQRSMPGRKGGCPVTYFHQLHGPDLPIAQSPGGNLEGKKPK